MDADERLTALKKAYADIILNTAKEAASRIMVSERKALRFQRELCVAKDEALQMLLRLKKMMDSKISEAEMASLSQQQKIEELEAQLQEAEDIVKDLREELREVQAELERVMSNKVECLNEHDTTTLDESVENRHHAYASQSIMYPPETQHEFVAASDKNISNLSHKNEGNKCYNATLHMRNTCRGIPDIPSIILRSKEPELYRNGCTQRIRACERNLLNEELSPTGQINDTKHETRAKEDEEGDKFCTTLTCGTNQMCTVEKKVVQAHSRLGSWYQAEAINCAHRRKNKAARSKRNGVLLHRNISNQLKKFDQAPDKSSTRTHQYSAEAQSSEKASHMAPRVTSDTIETGMQPGCPETTENEFVKSCVETKINESEMSKDKFIVTTLGSGSAVNYKVPVCSINLEKVDMPSVKLEESRASDTTSGIPGQPVDDRLLNSLESSVLQQKLINDRIIKYTFQRKRKRVSSGSSNGNAPSEKSISKRRTGEKQNTSSEPQKSGLITESSRDSRRLAQVARQLLSLSEKKW